MCGNTDTKYVWLLYLRSCFTLMTVYPLEIAGLGRILDIFAASMGMLQMLPLIFENKSQLSPKN